MRLKQMSMLALLAAPLTAQAALVEMADSELSTVNGQYDFSGRLFDYSATFAWNPVYDAPDFDVDSYPVLGGVAVETSFSTGWQVLPTWSVGVTGKYSGNTYYTSGGSGEFDPIDINWTNTRYLVLFH